MENRDRVTVEQQEEELLRIAREENLEEPSLLFREKRSFSVLAAYSDQRENAVLWLPIRKTDRVLELGAGCGALSGRLGKMAGEVTSFTGSETLAEAGRLRWKELKNLSFQSGDFRQALKGGKESYDWIIAGDERAVSPEDFPLLREHLREGGALFLAVTNPYGLPYFAGCPDPGSGRLFEGIEGYPERQSFRGRALSEWKDAFRKAGFEEPSVRYPFPDELFCNRLFSDDFLPARGELKNETRFLPYGRMRLFDEQRAFDHVREDGLFPVFSPGYYLVAGRGEELCIYAKFSTERSAAFRLETQIFQEKESRHVVKKAAGEESVSHVDRMESVYRETEERFSATCLRLNRVSRIRPGELSFEYLTGTNLESLLDTCLDSEESWEQKGIPLVERFAAEVRRLYGGEPFQMSEEFQRFFGPVHVPAGCLSARNVDIDMIFPNVLVQGDLWQVIDYEWTFPFLIPVNYLIYRALFYYVYQNEGRKRLFQEETFGRFGISPEEMVCYREMELHFQQELIRNDLPLRDMAGLSEVIEPSLLDAELPETGFRIGKEKKQINPPSMDAGSEEENRALEEKWGKMLKEKDDYIRDLERERGSLKSVLRQAGNILKDKTRKRERILREKSPFYSNWQARRERQVEENRRLRYNEYENWILRQEEQEEKSRAGKENTLSYQPLISVLVPVYNVLDMHLVPCIESVLNQTYPNFELILADDCSTFPNVRETLEKYRGRERVKVIYREKNGHISECTNTALDAAEGEFAGLLDCDDLLSPDALFQVASRLNEEPDLDFLYSDEDKVDSDGKHRHMPHFKPDWSPDTLMSQMYICHFSVYRTSLLRKAGGLRSSFNGSQDYDLALRISEMTDRIGHIPKILYHWRERAESTSGNADVKPYVFEAARMAKLDALFRRGIKGKAVLEPDTHQYNVVYDPPKDALVSVIIPSKDHPEVLRRCLSSLREITGWKRYEIILVDNGSSPENRAEYEKLAKEAKAVYLYRPMPFNFSAMCNLGAGEAKGDYLLFLNDDMEILKEDWMSILLGQAALPHAGCVGAKLLYPDQGGIQHVGVINIENGPCHAFSGMSDDRVYYFGRNRLVFNVLAVTAACLMIQKKKFDQVGGFEERLAVTYNDVDLCMKVAEAGYFNVVRPDAVLLHYESISRGNDAVDEAKMERLMAEQRFLYERHPRFDRKDPFYSPWLSQRSIDFANNYQKAESALRELPSPVSGGKDWLNRVRFSLVLTSVKPCVTADGWAFAADYPKNEDLKTELLLQGEKRSFILETEKIYRPDVAAAFPEEKELEYSGFRCSVRQELLPAGDYRIVLLLRSGRKTWRRETGQTLHLD